MLHDYLISRGTLDMGHCPWLHLVQYSLLPTSIFSSSTGYNIKWINGFYHITLPLFSDKRMYSKLGATDAQGIHCYETEVSKRRKKFLPSEHNKSQSNPNHSQFLTLLLKNPSECCSRSKRSNTSLKSLTSILLIAHISQGVPRTLKISSILNQTCFKY